MKGLTTTGASAFVRGYSGTAVAPSVSVIDYLSSWQTRRTSFTESQPEFGALRDCLMRECDRYLLLSVSNFARSLDSLRTSSVYWTAVGLYYSAFFAAKAIMAMHGCWLNDNKNWVEVISSNPGHQSLAHHRTKYCSDSGSHRVSWRAYYEMIRPLQQFIAADCTMAGTPVNGNPHWLIDFRNKVNYMPLEAFTLMTDFERSFDATRLPDSFSGQFRTLFNVSEAFLRLAGSWAAGYALSTDVYSAAGSRQQMITQSVTTPALQAILDFSAMRYRQLVF